MGSLSTTKRLNVQIIHNILVKNVLTEFNSFRIPISL